MFRVYAVNGTDKKILLDQRSDKYSLINPKLKRELNTAGSFTFSIAPNHVNKDCIQPLTTIFKVYRVLRDGSEKWLFSGRSLTTEEEFDTTGSITCEGILNIFKDSRVRPYEYTGSPFDYISQMVRQHNSQVNVKKQFKIGTIDVADKDGNQYITRSSEDYPDTLSEIDKKIIDELDTYISARDVDEVYYLDAFQSIPHKNKQKIEFAKNIIDLNKEHNAENVITVLVPLGKKDDETHKYLTIESVNGGKDFITNADAVSKYGAIVGIIKFDDVTTPAALLRKAQAYLAECNKTLTIEIKAYDLSLSDEEIESLELGWATVTSKPNDIINEDMLITKIELSLLDPDSNTITFGNTVDDLSGSVSNSQKDISRKVEAIRTDLGNDIIARIDNATQLITGAKGGYVLLDEDKDSGKPWRILIMDTDNVKTAKSVIQLNKNGIGFSTTGINGPYNNAWTIDGSLVADFITTGTMLANRIRGGTLEVGGTGLGKDGSIIVKDVYGNQVAKLDKAGLSATAGSFKGDITGASGTFSGNVKTVYGGFFSEISNGMFSGGLTGHSYTGYISFDSRQIQTNKYGTRIAGYGCVVISTESFGVAEYKSAVTDLTYMEGVSATTQYVKSIRDNGDGTITWEWGTITFTKGLMTTRL